MGRAREPVSMRRGGKGELVSKRVCE